MKSTTFVVFPISSFYCNFAITLVPMKLRFYSLCIFSFSLILIFSQCNKKKKTNEPEEPETTFDKQGMLTNIADNVILPAYNSFKISLDSLVNSYNTFKTSGTIADFQTVKQKYLAAYLKYQRIDLFELGPAESISIRGNFNVFPTDTAQIKSNISSGNYNLGSVSNIPAKGFPALDFLFYGKNQSELSVVQSFTTSANRKQYVSEILNEMSSKINSVISGWSTYKETFTNSLGTDIGSSIGYLVNQINYQLDYLKNSKIGIPLGKKSLGVILPDKCEAYYSSSHSLQFAIESLNLIENTYLGRSPSGNNDKGFDDYLDHIGAKHNGNSLNADINTQFAVTKSKLAAIQNPLSSQFNSNYAVVDAAYFDLVKLLVLLKTDMPSSLGVVITYQDGDGD